MFEKSLIQKLVTFKNRYAGSESERKASIFIADELVSYGLVTTIEEFKTQTSMPLIHLIHFLPLFFTCLIVNKFPLFGSAVGLLILISFWGEFTNRFFILRALLPKKTSQNVVAKIIRPEPLAKIIFSAHIDAAKTGVIFNNYISNLAGKARNKPIHKIILAFIFGLTIIFIIKAFGGGTWVLSIIFNFIAVLSLIASLLMLQWEFSQVSDGANDDLSGVAVVTSLANKLATMPNDNIDYYFLITGAEEAHCNGMRAFKKNNQESFSKDNSYFINLECVGGGKLKYVTEEGFIIFQKHHHSLIHACEQAAKKYNLDFRPTSTVAHSDSIVPLVAGYKSIGIVGLNENNVPTNYHTKNDRENNLNYELIQNAKDYVLKVIETLKEYITH